LATGYVLATASLLANRAIPGFTIAPSLRVVATGRVVGIPIMADRDPKHRPRRSASGR
jgi:ribose transport system permease protein